MLGQRLSARHLSAALLKIKAGTVSALAASVTSVLHCEIVAIIACDLCGEHEAPQTPRMDQLLLQINRHCLCLYLFYRTC